jgi:hypothetical protein
MNQSDPQDLLGYELSNYSPQHDCLQDLKLFLGVTSSMVRSFLGIE